MTVIPFTAAALALIAPLPAAQQNMATSVLFTASPVSPYHFNVPLQPTSTSVDRLIGGDLSGDGVLDLAILQNGVLSLAVDPSFADAPVDGPDQVIDAAIAKSTTAGDVDTLYVTTASGLERIDYGFDSQNFLVWRSVPLANSAWAGALKIHCADLDGVPGNELIAVGADGTSILYGFPSAATPTFDSTSRLTTIGTVDRIVVGKLRLAAAPSIVVSTSMGLEVYDSSTGKLVAWNNDALPARGLALVDHEGLGKERSIAWLRDVSPIRRRLTLFDPLLVEENRTDFIESVVGLAAADFDGNGSQELITTLSGGQHLRVLENLGGSFVANGIGTKTFDAIAGSPGVTSEPFLGDFDGDGDGDVAYVVPSTNELFLVRNVAENLNGAPELLRTGSGQPQIWVAGSGPSRTLKFRLDRTAAPPVGADAIEVMMWRSEAAAASVDYLTSNLPTSRILVGLNDNLETVSNPALTYQTVAISMPEDTATVEVLRYATARFVSLSGIPFAVDTVWPTTQIYFAHEFNPTGLGYVEDLVFTEESFEFLNEAPPVFPLGASATDPVTGDTVGSGGVTECVPDYPQNCPPGNDAD